MIKITFKIKNVTWTAAHLKPISPGYKTVLKEGRIQTLHEKLVLYKLILVNHRYVALTIVPQSLRRSVFSHLHDGPSGENMGEYKTLYRIRLLFFWPKLMEDVKQLIKGCAHCISYNVWRTWKQ